MISFSDFSFSYDGKKDILQNINCSFRKGVFYGITGSNGSGKSSLALAMAGLIPGAINGKYKGNIRINGILASEKPAGYFAHTVGLVFQNPDFSLFNLTVRDEILFGLSNLKLSRKEERLKKSLGIVGMTGTESNDPQTLSTGEKQKISLASVLALDTEYIILDEPTAQLDYKSSLELYGILQKMSASGKTVITIEHDTDFLAQYAKECLILSDGKVISFGNTVKVLSQKHTLAKLGIKIPWKFRKNGKA